MYDCLNGIVFESDLRDILSPKLADLELVEEFKTILDVLYKGRVIKLLNELISGESANYLNMNRLSRPDLQQAYLAHKYAELGPILKQYRSSIKGKSTTAVMRLNTADYISGPIYLSEFNPIISDTRGGSDHESWYEILRYLLMMFEYNYIDNTGDFGHDDSMLHLIMQDDLISYAIFNKG